MPTKSIDLPSLMERYHSEDKCRALLEDLRWPDGVRCPRCDGSIISRIKKRDQFDCDSCRYQFSVRAGTILHDSHLPLSKWFLATYIMCESKKGVSANQLHRMLKVPYKTAWYLCHRIRAAVKDDAAELLSGTVEVDETMIGGRKRGVGTGQGFRSKSNVIGAVERGGDVRLKKIAKRDGVTMRAFVRRVVDHDDTDRIITDEHKGYTNVGRHLAPHVTIKHVDEEWTRGDVHTNTIEGVWALFKRSIVGSYHQLSAKHLQSYLDEMAFRYNNRDNPYLFRDTLLRLIGADALPYEELVSP